MRGELRLAQGPGGCGITDDDSAGAFDARVSVTLAPGSYRVLATSAQGYAVGSYRLSVGSAPAIVQ